MCLYRAKCCEDEGRTKERWLARQIHFFTICAIVQKTHRLCCWWQGLQCGSPPFTRITKYLTRRTLASLSLLSRNNSESIGRTLPSSVWCFTLIIPHWRHQDSSTKSNLRGLVRSEQLTKEPLPILCSLALLSVDTHLVESRRLEERGKLIARFIQFLLEFLSFESILQDSAVFNW